MFTAFDLLGRIKLIDLSLELAEELPTSWPGHMPFRHQIGNWFERRRDLPQPLDALLGPYQTRWMVIDEHTGTHLDAPSHGIDPDDQEQGHLSLSIEAVSLDQVRGLAAVLDVNDDGSGDHATVSVGDIERHESEHGPITAGMIVLLRSGWDERYLPGADGERYVAGPLRGTQRGWPALDVDGMEALIGRGVRCVGTDSPSIGAARTGGPVHDVGFRRGLVFIEGLSRLHQLPPRGAYVMALPLRLRGGTGSPVRAVAFVEEKP